MTKFRAAVLLIALSAMTLLAAAPQHRALAQAAAAPRAEMFQIQPGAMQQAAVRRQCPRLCVEWFDGCNMCTCGKGFIDVCTQNQCGRYRRPRCVRSGF